MFRILLVLLLSVPAILCAQNTTSCAPLANDLNGDFIVGATDVLQLLASYGENYDVDGDLIPDCDDPCVGEYDECGVCNGPGPQVEVIDSIIVTLDSLYIEDSGEWSVFVADSDTLYALLCEEPSTFDSCGDDVFMDGHYYATVTIGDRCWFAENLRTTVYANGDLIPSGLSDQEWVSTTEGASSVYGEGSSECLHFSPDFDACDDSQALALQGRLYNSFAWQDARGLCPSGWHVPDEEEWYAMEDYASVNGFDGVEGMAMKSTSGWADNGNGTDDFGFAAYPSGQRLEDGSFLWAGNRGYWWFSSPNVSTSGYWLLTYSSSGFAKNVNFYPRSGISVRCIQDVD